MKEAILTYILGLHLAPICPTIQMGWHEAAFELAAGTVLAGVEWVWITVQTLQNASLTLSCCLSNCEGIKNIVTHLKHAVQHFLLGWELLLQRASLTLHSPGCLQ